LRLNSLEFHRRCGWHTFVGVGLNKRIFMTTAAGTPIVDNQRNTPEEQDSRFRVERRWPFRAVCVSAENDVSIPSPYKRSDTDIANALQSLLQWTAYWNKDSVRFAVEKGRVTLTGLVEWDYQRRTAAWAVKNLLGVTGVTNQIALKPVVVIVPQEREPPPEVYKEHPLFRLQPEKNNTNK
jgi:hypothetical protein